MIENSLSRRSFLTGAGIVTGAAVVVAGTSLIKPNIAEAAPTAFPWGYPASPGFSTADITTIKQNAYDYYYAYGGCMSGTGKALIVALINQGFTEWETFPQDLFKYGGGGVSTWGTICGALHGATYVIRALYAASSSTPTNVVNDLYQWYCNFNFPSTDHDGYTAHTVNGVAVPAATVGQTRTICNSPLCHASVSKWCHAHTPAKKVSAADRSNRCAKVAADVAGKTAELLNFYLRAQARPTDVPAFAQPDTTCSGCHVTGGTEKWVQMKSNCTSTCHAPGKNTTPIVGSACTRT